MTDYPLGFELFAPDGAGREEPHGDGSRVIGRIHGDEFSVMERADGRVVVVDRATGEVVPLNRDREALEEFLEAFDEYVRDGPPTSGPVVRTAAQMAERLALMRAGALKPAAPRTPAVSHERRYERLRKRCEAADRDALGVDGWWTGTLEQAEDEQI
ncbi:SUKH-4 family immunity protein [Clavibacter sp. Sh2036]|uniref:SUKH-4 family immunity protein n=1 Tax=unclassified Clavibacter TaxID=2626594 RepID=UPI0022EA57E7|nr:SUKH-4 family immunity protein [Clavibacter sp. CT19]MDA3804457.1 SUKH-4 family immunity protein [Clavibacter sp. CT19]